MRANRRASWACTTRLTVRPHSTTPPTCIRWPGVIKPGTIHNEAFSHYDLIPTFCAAAGEPDIVAKCLTGYAAGTKTFKVHLDGYNLMPFLSGSANETPRRDFLYGRAMARVVAHELYHVLMRSAEHARGGVARSCFNTGDLLTERFEFEGATLARLRSRIDAAPDAFATGDDATGR